MMDLFRASRTRRGPDPYLPHKMLIFVIGAALGIAGIASERTWLVNVGIGVLLLGVVLRVIAQRKRNRSSPDS
ncbi:MAG: hypothetical protein ACREMQ_06295 [Longimicrobiales bacterium]